MPQKLINIDGGESGNDVYYSLGVDYKFTENFHLGVEYSAFTINENSNVQSTDRDNYKHEVKDISLVLGWTF